MAAVTDPNAIRFSNTRVRVLADRIGQMYNFILMASNEYTAQGLSTSFPNDSSSIVDGAAQDGRPQIVGTDVNNIITLANTLKTTLEANSKLLLNQALKVGVNTGI